MSLAQRRTAATVVIGQLTLGSRQPVVIQSMTNTLTDHKEATLAQTKELIEAGSEMVRWTINSPKAAQCAVRMIDHLRTEGYVAPIIGDFHFNGHQLLKDVPGLAQKLDKYRINPGNVGRGEHHDENFSAIIKIAVDNDKPVRIGVNGGSLDPDLLTRMMNENAHARQPKDDHMVLLEAMVESVLTSARCAEQLGLSKNKIVISAKMSGVQDTIALNQRLAQECEYVLHLGVTEAGSDVQGLTASSAALAVLLQQGIGDTIRISLTPQPGGSRAQEVQACRALLQSMGLRYFEPSVTSCPGCGRTDSDRFIVLADEIKQYIRHQMPQWKTRYPGVERMRIAVMGCVVNGPGEAKHADIGISLPGASETPQAVVFVKGKKDCVLDGEDMKEKFIQRINSFLEETFAQ